MQREFIVTLLEESDFKVFCCESAEAGMLLLDKFGAAVSFLFTDVNLAGVMTGDALARKAAQRFPEMKIVVTSGAAEPKLPSDMLFMRKPWRALDVLREAERAAH